MSANPTAVNSFTGLSDNAVAEDKLGSLWDAGAFNADGKPDVEQGQAAPEPPAAAQTQLASPAQPSPVEPVAGDQNEVEYTDLSDYLTKSNIDPESFYKIPAPVKVNGETKNVPLSDLLKSYQQESDYTQKTQALAEQRRVFEASRQEAVQVYQNELKQAQTLGQLAHQELLGQYKSIDWNKLRQEDPAQWAVLNTEFNMKANTIQNHLTQVQQLQQQQAWQQQQDLNTKILPQEREKVLEARPEWRDEKQFEAARTQMQSAAKKLGFTDAELSQVYDHRYMLALDLASRYLALQASTPEAVKRVRTAPISAQPGARTQRDPKAVAQAQLKEQFKKNPRDQDNAARYFGTLS